MQVIETMALAIPLLVVSIEGSRARVKEGTKLRTVDISLLGGLKEGDYVFVHGNLGIQALNAEHAEEIISLLSDREALPQFRPESSFRRPEG